MSVDNSGLVYGLFVVNPGSSEPRALLRQALVENALSSRTKSTFILLSFLDYTEQLVTCTPIFSSKSTSAAVPENNGEPL